MGRGAQLFQPVGDILTELHNTLLIPLEPVRRSQKPRASGKHGPPLHAQFYFKFWMFIFNIPFNFYPAAEPALSGNTVIWSHEHHGSSRSWRTNFSWTGGWLEAACDKGRPPRLVSCEVAHALGTSPPLAATCRAPRTPSSRACRRSSPCSGSAPWGRVGVGVELTFAVGST
jgi:hypothetical protein